ncbi:MAG: hypothetical protein Q8Q08_11300 [Candidatus Omnitrophota bacterium]|nr:hypothetical protein [Candidatus Omnitrophota bacterium]MDZ4241480.1 hypothetical protein [Candidatus Omnitrophota bacterium]
MKIGASISFQDGLLVLKGRLFSPSVTLAGGGQIFENPYMLKRAKPPKNLPRSAERQMREGRRVIQRIRQPASNRIEDWRRSP